MVPDFETGLFTLDTLRPYIASHKGHVEVVDFAGAEDPYILKSIGYDPVHRLDLTTLPRPSARHGRQDRSALP